MVEIARAVSYESDILIMDEPTSTLSEREVDRLFGIIADLKARGSAVIYITHRINEVFRIASEVSVLRDGQMVGSDAVERLDRDRLIAMMVGRELTQLFPKSNRPTDRVALSVKHLSLNGIFSDVSFDVRAGEIFGIAGLVGSRRTEVAETIFGLRRATSGEILIDGVPVDVDSPATAIRRGMAFLTEDREDERALPAVERPGKHGSDCAQRTVHQHGLRQTEEAACRMRRHGRHAAREDAGPVRAGSESQRRQPAEGAGRPMAVDVSTDSDSR